MNRPTQASVRVRSVNEAEVFVAENARRPARYTQEQIATDDPEIAGVVNAEHTRPDRVLMWKPRKDDKGVISGFEPREAPVTNIIYNLSQGWLQHCPDCGTNHEDSPLPVSDPNSCPAREKVMVRLCPVCGDRMVDNQGWSGEEKGITIEGEPVAENDFAVATPEQRTRAQLNVHLWMRHPRQAQMMGIPELSTAYRPPSQPPQTV